MIKSDRILKYLVVIILSQSVICVSDGFSAIADEDYILITQGYVQVDQGQIYYEMAGEGRETIILIHDGLVHREVWDNQFHFFEETYRVIRYDRRGYGLSAKPQAAYSDIEDLHQLMDTLKVDQAILIGMSSGGGLAINFSLQYPERVTSLVLVGAVVSGFGYTEHFITRGGRLTLDIYNQPDSLMHYIIEDDPYEISQKNSSARDRVRKLLNENPQNMDISRARLQKPLPRPAIDHLNEIQMPTLIIVGEYDIPDVHAHAGALQAGIRGAERIVMPGAGHLVPVERPEAFNQKVQEFLAGAPFFSILYRSGVNAAVKFYGEEHRKNPDWIPFTENRINMLGYKYLQSGETEQAISLFKLNTLAFPNSSNVYDSLGEAYMINGDRKLAIENYRKSLKLNPDNKNAEIQLDQLTSLPESKD